MKTYRATVTKEGSTVLSFDIEASDNDVAFHKAYCQCPDHLKTHTELNIEEIPTGTSNWGIHFQYEDRISHKTYSDYLVIRAESEKQAKDYYDSQLKGERFWFHSGKVEPDGKHIYGSILDTYIAACPGFDADATKGG